MPCIVAAILWQPISEQQLSSGVGIKQVVSVVPDQLKWPQGASFGKKEAPARRKAVIAICRRCTHVRIDRK